MPSHNQVVTVWTATHRHTHTPTHSYSQTHTLMHSHFPLTQIHTLCPHVHTHRSYTHNHTPPTNPSGSLEMGAEGLQEPPCPSLQQVAAETAALSAASSLTLVPAFSWLTLHSPSKAEMQRLFCHSTGSGSRACVELKLLPKRHLHGQGSSWQPPGRRLHGQMWKMSIPMDGGTTLPHGHRSWGPGIDRAGLGCCF